jgi:hypothetical protein
MSVDVGGSVVVCVTTLIEPTEIETRGVVVVSFVGRNTCCGVGTVLVRAGREETAREQPKTAGQGPTFVMGAESRSFTR